MLATSRENRRETGHVEDLGSDMADMQVLQERAATLLELAPTRQPGGAADGVGRVVGEACRRGRFRGADRRQPPGRRLGRQVGQRRHDVRRRCSPGSPRSPARSTSRSPSTSSRDTASRRPPHRRPARCRGGGPEHRGHRARRGRAAAIVHRTRRAGRCAAGRRRRGRGARGDQRAHRSVPPAGRRRIRPCRTGRRAADRMRRRGRRRPCTRSAATIRIRCDA